MLSFTFECAHAIKLTHISSQPHTHTQAHKRIHTHVAENVNLFFVIIVVVVFFDSFWSVQFAVVQKCCSIARRLHSLKQSYTLVEKLHEPHIFTSFDDNQSYLACSRATDQTGWSCESLVRSVLCCVSTSTHAHKLTDTHALTQWHTHLLVRSHSV